MRKYAKLYEYHELSAEGQAKARMQTYLELHKHYIYEEVPETLLKQFTRSQGILFTNAGTLITRDEREVDFDEIY